MALKRKVLSPRFSELFQNADAFSGVRMGGKEGVEAAEKGLLMGLGVDDEELSHVVAFYVGKTGIT